MPQLITVPLKLDHEPAKRCPDYDEECIYVNDHFKCWTGQTCDGYELDDVTDHYCPFVCGMKK